MAKLEGFDNMPELFDNMPELEPVHPHFKVLEVNRNSNLFLPKEKNNNFVEEKDSNSVGRNSCIGQSPGTHNREGVGVRESDLNFSDGSCHGNSSTFSQSPHQNGKMLVTGRRNERVNEAAFLNRPRKTTTLEGSEQECGYYAENPGALGRMLAAEGLLLDSLIWVTFDPDEFPASALQAEAEKFLAKSLPSKVKRSDGFAWIYVHAPDGDDDEEDEVRDRKEEEKEDSPLEEGKEGEGDSSSEEEDEEENDVDGLLDAWAKLIESGEEINFQKIQQLALAHRTLCGKWMIFRKRGIHTDLTWERIFRATVKGHLGSSAKVSSVDQDKYTHVICVYNENFTDQAEVRELESRLRAIGIRCPMMYKPDVFTYLGVYRGNEWNLKPVVYVSEFDLRKNSSTIFSNYECLRTMMQEKVGGAEI